MFPAAFDYVRADSVDDAVSLLTEHGDGDVELLAGGHSLLPTIKSGLAAPDVLVDLSGVEELATIEVDDDTSTIGATTTYVEVTDHADLAHAVPDFAEAVAAIGDRQVRNVGTVGGNIAHADPASDLPGVILAADATLHVTGPDGDRAVSADDFFLAMYTTDVGPAEVLTAVELPNLGEHDTGVYVKRSSPSSGYAMIGVAARVFTDGETITDARVAANGAFETARRLEPVEDALVDASITEEVAADAAARATEDVEEWELMDDVQVSSDFRGHLLEVYTERALDRAFDRLG